MQPLAVDVREFARLFSVSPRSARRWIKAGRVQAIRLSTRVLVPVTECERLAREGLPKEQSNGK
jgi:predicted site-specific integrase-resolvase